MKTEKRLNRYGDIVYCVYYETVDQFRADWPNATDDEIDDAWGQMETETIDGKKYHVDHVF